MVWSECLRMRDWSAEEVVLGITLGSKILEPGSDSLGVRLSEVYWQLRLSV